MSSASLPNLLIAGAPKCGTSAFFNWLADHPCAQGSTPKELFYLMDSEHPFAAGRVTYHDRGIAGYSTLFEHYWGRDVDVVFEATTHYLYQRTALEVLSNLDPPPRILFLFRRPSHRLYSSFQYTKNNLGLIGGDLSFADYLDLLENPNNDLRRIVRDPRSAYVLRRDREYGQYADYLEAWLRRFPPGRVSVRLFENMVRDPAAFMSSVCEFLGLDKGFYATYEFGKHNETVAVRSRPVQRWASHIASALPRGPVRDTLSRAYRRLFVGRAPQKSPRDRWAIAELDRYYAPHNERLQALTGLDLSLWRDADP